MSFGVSVGDFVAVRNLALQVYRACKGVSASLQDTRFDQTAGAAGQFEEVFREVSAVSLSLKTWKTKRDSLINRQGSHKSLELKSIIDNTRLALEELGDLARRYASLSTTQKRKWDVIRFATKDITDIRARLVLHIQAAQAVLDGLQAQSLAHIELQNDDSHASLGRLETESANTRQTLARIEQLLAEKSPGGEARQP